MCSSPPVRFQGSTFLARQGTTSADAMEFQGQSAGWPIKWILRQQCACQQQGGHHVRNVDGHASWQGIADISIIRAQTSGLAVCPHQAENDALQQLVVEVAANKAEARAKVARLKEKYNHLLRKVGRLPTAAGLIEAGGESHSLIAVDGTV